MLILTKMEKSEFQVLIKHYFLFKKTISKTMERLDKYYGHSARSTMVKNGLLSSVVVVPAQVRLNVQNA